MDIQDYISSGKLELFVLGDLNETEQQEVLAMAKKYPEIEQEIIAIEEAYITLISIQMLKKGWQYHYSKMGYSLKK